MSIVIRASREKSLRDCSHIFGSAFRESFYDARHLSFAIPGGTEQKALRLVEWLRLIGTHCRIPQFPPKQKETHVAVTFWCGPPMIGQRHRRIYVSNVPTPS
jgi:hypothetical protein